MSGYLPDSAAAAAKDVEFRLVCRRTDAEKPQHRMEQVIVRIVVFRGLSAQACFINISGMF